MNGLRHQPFVGADGSGFCEVTLLGETCRAEMVLSGRIPESKTAAGTTGVREKFYPFCAEKTRMVVGLFPQFIAAEEVLGREEEID